MRPRGRPWRWAGCWCGASWPPPPGGPKRTTVSRPDHRASRACAAAAPNSTSAMPGAGLRWQSPASGGPRHRGHRGVARARAVSAAFGAGRGPVAGRTRDAARATRAGAGPAPRRGLGQKGGSGQMRRPRPWHRPFGDLPGDGRPPGGPRRVAPRQPRSASWLRGFVLALAQPRETGGARVRLLDDLPGVASLVAAGWTDLRDKIFRPD
jgi:hypothetical protein